MTNNIIITIRSNGNANIDNNKESNGKKRHKYHSMATTTKSNNKNKITRKITISLFYPFATEFILSCRFLSLQHKTCLFLHPISIHDAINVPVIALLILTLPSHIMLTNILPLFSIVCLQCIAHNYCY